MPVYTIDEVRIKVSKDEITFTIGTVGKPAVPFPQNRFSLEFSIARIFHRVLNVYRKFEEQIFEHDDYMVLGNTLSKILFENEETDENNRAIGSLKQKFRSVYRESGKRCRIYLEFQSGIGNIALLPWEYIRLMLPANDGGTRPFPVYLAADEESKFDLIRSFPEYDTFNPPVPSKKLNVVVVTANCTNGYDVDDDKFIEWCKKIENENKETIKFHELRQPEDKREEKEHTFTARLRDITKSFVDPYILHYLGHAKIKKDNDRVSVGNLCFVGYNSEPVWIDDRKFATLLSGKNLRKPHLVIMQACSSGQVTDERKVNDPIPRLEFCGIAVSLLRNEIPAVVAMQNDITEIDSTEFLEIYYNALLAGDDVAEAVTKGRTHLAYPDGVKDHSSNIFGTPVLFLSVPQPFSFITKEKQSDQEASSPLYKYCVQCKEPFENVPGNRHESHKMMPLNEEQYRMLKEETSTEQKNKGAQLSQAMDNASEKLDSPPIGDKMAAQKD